MRHVTLPMMAMATSRASSFLRTEYPGLHDMHTTETTNWHPSYIPTLAIRSGMGSTTSGALLRSQGMSMPSVIGHPDRFGEYRMRTVPNLNMDKTPGCGPAHSSPRTLAATMDAPFSATMRWAT